MFGYEVLVMANQVCEMYEEVGRYEQNMALLLTTILRQNEITNYFYC